MDPDVVNYVVSVLENTPLQVRGSELATYAELHKRALEQVRSATVEPPPDGVHPGP